MRILIALLMLMSGQAAPVERQVAFQRENVIGHSGFIRAGEWEVARWTGPQRDIGFGATEIAPSWTADTPLGTWIKVELQVPGSRWYVVGRSSYDGVHASGGQGDEQGRVVVDVFKAAKPVAAYRLRVALYRRPGSAVQPVVRTLGAVASREGRTSRGAGPRVASASTPE